jgi:hypothetical protein
MLSQKETIMVFRVAFYEFDAAKGEVEPALTIEFHAMRSNFEAASERGCVPSLPNFVILLTVPSEARTRM